MNVHERDHAVVVQIGVCRSVVVPVVTVHELDHSMLVRVRRGVSVVVSGGAGTVGRQR